MVLLDGAYRYSQSLEQVWNDPTKLVARSMAWDESTQIKKSIEQARKRVNRRLNFLIMMTAVGSLWLKVSHTSAHDLEESAKSYLTEIS